MLLRLRSREVLPGLVGGRHVVVHGLIAAILGHMPEAELILRKEIVTSKIPEFTSNLKEAAKRVGVKL